MKEASCLPETLSESKWNKDRLTAENKVVLALVTNILDLKTTAGSLTGSLQELKARSNKTKRDI